MSATRDKSQKITFVYSNLYALYRKGVEGAREGAIENTTAVTSKATSPAGPVLAPGERMRVPQVFESGVVIKAKDAAAQTTRVSPYSPAELLGKRIARPASLPALSPQIAAARPAPATPEAVESLKRNLASLNDLQSRLRFMLKELEELMRE